MQNIYSESNEKDCFKSSEFVFRHFADSLNFYIGTIGKVKTIHNPLLYSNFNSITVENELKIGSLLKDNKIGEYDFRCADSIVNAALEKDLRIRGHTLVWGKASDKFKSPDLNFYLNGFPEKDRSKILWDLVENHITTVLNHYQGKILVWDAVNEPLATWGSGKMENNVFYRYLGEDYIEKVFHLAYSIDPGLKLYLNELFWNYSGRRAESFINLVSTLKENKVPIHGVGIQAHIPFRNVSLEDMEAFIQRITDMGIEVELTELDARLRLFRSERDPYQAQGEFYAKVLMLCLRNPLCKGVTFWGFNDADCWYDDEPLFRKPNEPYLFDKQMNPKPAFFVVYHVLKDRYER